MQFAEKGLNLRYYELVNTEHRLSKTCMELHSELQTQKKNLLDVVDTEAYKKRASSIRNSQPSDLTSIALMVSLESFNENQLKKETTDTFEGYILFANNLMQEYQKSVIQALKTIETETGNHPQVLGDYLTNPMSIFMSSLVTQRSNLVPRRKKLSIMTNQKSKRVTLNNLFLSYLPNKDPKAFTRILLQDKVLSKFCSNETICRFLEDLKPHENLKLQVYQSLLPLALKEFSGKFIDNLETFSELLGKVKTATESLEEEFNNYSEEHQERINNLLNKDSQEPGTRLLKTSQLIKVAIQTKLNEIRNRKLSKPKQIKEAFETYVRKVDFVIKKSKESKESSPTIVKSKSRESMITPLKCATSQSARSKIPRLSFQALPRIKTKSDYLKEMQTIETKLSKVRTMSNLATQRNLSIENPTSTRKYLRKRNN